MGQRSTCPVVMFIFFLSMNNLLFYSMIEHDPDYSYEQQCKPNGGSFIQENKNKTKRVIRFRRIMIQLKQKCTFSEQMMVPTQQITTLVFNSPCSCLLLHYPETFLPNLLMDFTEAVNSQTVVSTFLLHNPLSSKLFLFFFFA